MCHFDLRIFQRLSQKLKGSARSELFGTIFHKRQLLYHLCTHSVLYTLITYVRNPATRLLFQLNGIRQEIQIQIRTCWHHLPIGRTSTVTTQGKLIMGPLSLRCSVYMAAVLPTSC
ncbi:Hypothetical_protein [Hexamita inflata]|uniref:Hypothetical_protein n=1 Tax=Hexamita inflata TaxID=28002 RepID=A0AA86TYZ4_9EUKA|nr:Hypothetical protein HINF_LOCUS13323 [Hexamita inflata]